MTIVGTFSSWYVQYRMAVVSWSVIVCGMELPISHHASVFSFDISALDCFPFIVFLLSFSERNNEFDVFTCGEKFYRNDRHPRLFVNCELIDLFATSEKFSRFRIDGSSVDLPSFVDFEAETGVIEPEFIIFDSDESAFELYVAFAGGANLGAGQNEADDDFIAQLIVKPRPTIDDGTWFWCG